jgi:hypothetical protein
MLTQDGGIENLVNIFSHSKSRVRKVEKSLEISDHLILDYMVENLDDSVVNSALNEGENVCSLIILDYLLDQNLKLGEVIELSARERICYAGNQLINKQINWSESKKKENGNCFFPKRYVEFLCLTYINILKNPIIKPLIREAKNRRDLKGIILIDTALGIVDTEQGEKTLAGDSSINQKVLTLLQLAYLEERITGIPQEVSQYIKEIPLAVNKKIDRRTILYVNSTIEDIKSKLTTLDSLKDVCRRGCYANLIDKINKRDTSCKESLESIYSFLTKKGGQLLEALKEFSHLIDKTSRWNLIRTYVLKDKLKSYHTQIQLLKEVM